MSDANKKPSTGRISGHDHLPPGDEAWEALKQAGLRRARLERSAAFHALFGRVASWSPFRRRAAERRLGFSGRHAGHRG
ncbi:MAG: hypothetical protein RLO50_00095 [Azospirillaceae bacterium]